MASVSVSVGTGTGTGTGTLLYEYSTSMLMVMVADGDGAERSGPQATRPGLFRISKLSLLFVDEMALGQLFGGAK